MYVTTICLPFDERLSIHCNIRGFTFAQEEFQILCRCGRTTINKQFECAILALNAHQSKPTLFFRNTARFKAVFLWGKQTLLYVIIANKSLLFFGTVGIKQAIERDAHFWECLGSFIITERMACMIRHWALADSVGCDHTYRLTDTVPPTPFCQ